MIFNRNEKCKKSSEKELKWMGRDDNNCSKIGECASVLEIVKEDTSSTEWAKFNNDNGTKTGEYKNTSVLEVIKDNTLGSKNAEYYIDNECKSNGQSFTKEKSKNRSIICSVNNTENIVNKPKTIAEYFERKLKPYQNNIILSNQDGVYLQLSSNNKYVSDVLRKILECDSKDNLISELGISLDELSSIINFASSVLEPTPVNSNNYNLYDDPEKNEVAYRIAMFKKEYWPPTLIEKIFLFDPLEDRFFLSFRKWSKRKYRELPEKRSINIWRMEEFINWREIIPIKKISIELGFREIKLDNFKKKGIIDDEDINRMLFSDGFVYNNFIEDFSKLLFLNYDYNKDEDEILLKIREIIDNIDLGFEKLYINEEQTFSAEFYDVLTGRPICKENCVMLNFKLPLYFDPVFCSIDTAEKYKILLKSYLPPSFK